MAHWTWIKSSNATTRCNHKSRLSPPKLLWSQQYSSQRYRNHFPSRACRLHSRNFPDFPSATSRLLRIATISEWTGNGAWLRWIHIFRPRRTGKYAGSSCQSHGVLSMPHRLPQRRSQPALLLQWRSGRIEFLSWWSGEIWNPRFW